MDIDMISIGQRIKKRRNELNLTQMDVYRQCGIASGALSLIENGSRTPSILVFHRLSQVLNCSMDWLLSGDSFDKEPKISKEKNEDSQLKENDYSELEEELISGFRKLSEIDQDEILDIIEIKLRKNRRTKRAETKSSYSDDEPENHDMVG